MMQLAFQVSIWSWVREIQHSSPFSTEIENCTTEMQEFIPSLYTDQHPGSGHQSTWGLMEAKPSIMAPTGGAKPGLQVWETAWHQGGASQWFALHVKARSSVLRLKRMSTGTVYKLFWAIITSKMTAPESGVLMNYKKTFSQFSCKGFHNPTLGIKVIFRK